jgi:hypothetical protein
MAERQVVTDFIDRVVRESNIVSGSARADLRRELESHFADAGTSSEALHAALHRFGNPAHVGRELERAHRRGRLVARLARVIVAMVASAGVALAIQVVANLHVDWQSEAVRLGPGFTRSAWFSGMIIIALVAAWELDIGSLCGRLERHPVRLAVTIGALAATMLLFHAMENTLLLPGLALYPSTGDVFIWVSTNAILARHHRASAGVFR